MQAVAGRADNITLRNLRADRISHALTFTALWFPFACFVPAADIEALTAAHMVKVKRPRRKISPTTLRARLPLLRGLDDRVYTLLVVTT